jgi:hypothetical protein
MEEKVKQETSKEQAARRAPISCFLKDFGVESAVPACYYHRVIPLELCGL